MDAKTAAAKVQNGLQDLSDKELVEILFGFERQCRIQNPVQ